MGEANAIRSLVTDVKVHAFGYGVRFTISGVCCDQKREDARPHHYTNRTLQSTAHQLAHRPHSKVAVSTTQSPPSTATEFLCLRYETTPWAVYVSVSIVQVMCTDRNSCLGKSGLYTAIFLGTNERRAETGERRAESFFICFAYTVICFRCLSGSSGHRINMPSQPEPHPLMNQLPPPCQKHSLTAYLRRGPSVLHLCCGCECRFSLPNRPCRLDQATRSVAFAPAPVFGRTLQSLSLSPCPPSSFCPYTLDRKSKWMRLPPRRRNVTLSKLCPCLALPPLALLFYLASTTCSCF